MLIALFMGSELRAAFILSIDSSSVLPNSQDQVVSIYLIGGPQVQGVNFNLQIEPDGNKPAPVITALDLIGEGTIFQSNNSGENILALGEVDPDEFSGYQFALATTTVLNLDEPVYAQGLLARIAIDTTGIFSGVFRFNMSSTFNGPTDFPFGTVATQISRFEGEMVSIGVIPEPSSCIVFGIGLVMLLLGSRLRTTAALNGSVRKFNDKG